MYYNTDIFRPVGTWLVSNLHVSCLALSIPAMNDHSLHFNNVLMRRPFSANIMKNLLFYARKKNISKMQQPSCLLFFIVVMPKLTDFLFSHNILKERCWGSSWTPWFFQILDDQVYREFQVQVEESTLLHDEPDNLLLLALKRGI